MRLSDIVPLIEAKVEQLRTDTGTVKILINPMRSELISMVMGAYDNEVRGFSDDQNIYVWAAMEETHFGAFGHLKQAGYFPDRPYARMRLMIFTVTDPRSSFFDEVRKIEGRIRVYFHEKEQEHLDHFRPFTRLLDRA